MSNRHFRGKPSPFKTRCFPKPVPAHSPICQKDEVDLFVGTAKDAISSMRKQKFDLMFLDLQLPDAPGDQVYKTAKSLDPDLNVIVITGYPDSEVLDRILQISPVTVLKKPLKIEQLNQTVKILGHSTSRVEVKEVATGRNASTVVLPSMSSVRSDMPFTPRTLFQYCWGRSTPRKAETSKLRLIPWEQGIPHPEATGRTKG
jgi:CheY-like chemotaxis protein